jgi:hypothetical protein
MRYGSAIAVVMVIVNVVRWVESATVAIAN